MAAKEPVLRLLLVDDEEEFLLATSQALGRRGFAVTVAPNGVTALERIEAGPFDAVVLDVKMPDIDGIDVFHQIQERFPEIPIIILTGHPNLTDAFRTSRQGVAEYMSKPVEIEELAKSIRKAVRKAAASSTTESSKLSRGSLGDGLTPLRVMIVDDEPDLLDSLGRALRRRKMEVVTAGSGFSALELLEKELVDVMVLDIKMPGIDGLEVLRRVKKRFPSVQVILLSGHPSVENALEGINLGANEYMKKPAEIDDLVETITRLHRERQEVLEEQQRKLIDDIRRRYAD